ncbi:MAG TPA: DUF5107 domain-containing protein [Flexilinea sp.]|nr:DUF5107 domain-containing protein [Flexilinea sp.]
MNHIKNQVEIWEEEVSIPTYEVGIPEKNPMFFENRVYQGSSGKVYPFPIIESISNKKIDKKYQAVFLENDYLFVMILPELGGRIQRALDKSNNYDFVYYNEVIKPALVGLTGPWISGGIEFNWPQHHRPTTFLPVLYRLQENSDGSKTVQMSDMDRMYGTKEVTNITLYPDKAYIEIKGQLYNPTSSPQTFLWWANPAVPANEYTQSIFPPDVTAVMDHGKRDVSKFPIADGIYYKYDYSKGVDISYYKNIPVPTSYMAYRSDYDFVGCYDHQREAGILHIADHHISPGKKQWTWGCGDFGKAWERNLTDHNGAYIELMAGVYTDNQPDFTWLKPFEEKRFTQYFLPYKKVGQVKNATKDVLLSADMKGNHLEFSIYGTHLIEDIRVFISGNNHTVFDQSFTVSPTQIISESVLLPKDSRQNLKLSIFDREGEVLLTYSLDRSKKNKLPSPATPAPNPKDIATNEELFLHGIHLEQYRHPTFDPDPYYLEGLKRDPGDSRINNAYGMLILRRGLIEESEQYFRNAIKRITMRNPNPYDGEPYYNLGYCLFLQGRFQEAFDAFYKATWSESEQEKSFYYLATIKTIQRDYDQALDFIENSLLKNLHNLKARGLKTILLRKMGRSDEAKIWAEETNTIDPFDLLALNERKLLSDDTVRLPFTIRPENFNFVIEAASDYASYGCYKEAIDLLDRLEPKGPMIHYSLAYYYFRMGDLAESQKQLKSASESDPSYCFPNRIEDIAVLNFAITQNPDDSYAYYYLGNLYYDKKQYQKALTDWKKSTELNDRFATSWRNLAIILWNKEKKPQEAIAAMEKAFSLDPNDARILFESDQLYKKANYPIHDRLENLEKHQSLLEKRDDLYTEYITLLNLSGQYEKALEKISGHIFHPWEGGEGKITSQYKIAHLEMAKKALVEKNSKEAERLLLEALTYPLNLGEGKLIGTKDNDIYYFLGCCYEQACDEDKAVKAWIHACKGSEEISGEMYYYDQPADMILYQGLALFKLTHYERSDLKFHKLIYYGEQHMEDTVTMDYFAVSLPDMQLLEEDLSLRNRAHCHYLIGLGNLGLRNWEKASDHFKETLKINNSHVGANIHLALSNTAKSNQFFEKKW